METTDIDTPEADLEYLKLKVIERYQDDSDVAQLVVELEDRLKAAEAGVEYYLSGHAQNGPVAPPPPRFIPARVRLNCVVRGDGPFNSTYAPPGDYDCSCNRWGAASVKATNGKMLGIRLYEFSVLSWVENPQYVNE